LTETKDSQEEEDDTFEEDSGNSLLVADRSGTLYISSSPSMDDRNTHVETDLTVCEISIDTETRSETEGEIGKETHRESSDKSDTRSSDDVISP
jgi:hypothetical protein